VAQLGADLDSGAWDARHGHLRGESDRARLRESTTYLPFLVAFFFLLFQLRSYLRL
jgi:hypothetical protein